MEHRSLTEAEERLLQGLLDHDFEGVDALREQLAVARAASNCACGCGSIRVLVPAGAVARSPARSPLPVEAQILDDDANVIGGAIVFLRDGLLHDVDVFSVGEPLPMPGLDRVRWLRTS